MNDAIRWTLIPGCLLLAILEAPQSSLVLVQDLRGPWCSELSADEPVLDPVSDAIFESPDEHVPAHETPTDLPGALKPLGAFAFVAPEDVLGLDCSPPARSARHPVSKHIALVVAR